MHAYVTTETEILQTPQQSKATVPAQNLEEASVREIQLDAGEYQILKDLLKEKHQLDDEQIKTRLRLGNNHEIAQWEGFPPRLGRISLGLYEHGAMQDHQQQSAPLAEQLAQLRQRLPQRRHFRIALVNGFGSNLGDNLMGITAFLHVAKVLEAELPAFSIDVLMGWKTGSACRDMLYRLLPCVQNVYYSGLSLAEFGHYDAHFDTSHLLGYPRYDSLPAVDWYLWWLGLEHEQIAAADKRNRLQLPHAPWQEVAQLLRTGEVQPEGKSSQPLRRVLFCHKASVPLRSIPKAQARRLASELLSANKQLQLIVDFSLDLKHPRLLDLDGKINSPDKFMALIAQVDGLITIDSFSQHVADACATPTLLLACALPAAHYPYYPYMHVHVLPGAEQLPGWGRTKTESDEEWDGMATQYEQAWQRLKGKPLWPLLEEKIAQRSTQLESAPVQLQIAADQRGVRGFCQLAPATHSAPAHLRWTAENPSPAWEKVNQRLIELGSAILRRGSVVVHCGAGSSATAQRLAELIQPRGQYHLWEPRRLYAQTQAANFMLAGLDNLHLHQHLPAIGATQACLPDLDPYSESNPQQAGNARYQTDVTAAALDSVDLPMCRLLIVQPPLLFDEVLGSAQELLAKHKPWVLLGPLSQQQAWQAGEILQRLDYALWAEIAQNASSDAEQALLMVGVPSGSKADMSGFMKVEINEE